MTNEEMIDRDLIEAVDENGNTMMLEVCDYFFYNGDEYATLCPADDEDEESFLIMKINPFTDENGEEMEEFVPVEEELMEPLIQIARTRILEETDEDDE